MTMIVGGSAGVTYPDGTVLTAASVTSQLGPAITDTSNIMTINPLVRIDGTNGIYANGTRIITSPLIITLSTTVTNYNLYTAAVAAFGSTSLPPVIKLIVTSTGVIGGDSATSIAYGPGTGYLVNNDPASQYLSPNSGGLYPYNRCSLKGATGIIIPNSFATGTQIQIQIQAGGSIYAGAGCGGISGTNFGNPSTRYGGDGGDAIQIQGAYAVSITNAGNIWGGGGGGAGAPVDQYADARRWGGLGYGYDTQISRTGWNNAPIAAFGISGTGGYGGTWGAAGTNNSTANSSGGLAGKAINNIGGATISLTNTGSILGATA